MTHDDSESLFARAALGSEPEAAEFERRNRAFLAAIQDEGRGRYGDLGIARGDLVRGVARLLSANLAAEVATGVPAEDVDLEGLRETLVKRDAYFVQGLIAGHAGAWNRFSEILDQAHRTVRAHFAGVVARTVLAEIRETILGTFFLDGKIQSYRATAPIGAWARQVIFNAFRQAMNRRKRALEPKAFSQLGSEDGESENFLPPALTPPPPEILDRSEWGEWLAVIVPESLLHFDRDERRMLDMLPSKRMTQVDLCQELGVSPFKLNRWYKEVRQRFLREVTRRLRFQANLDEIQADRLVAYLASVWEGSPPAESDLTQDPNQA